MASEPVLSREVGNLTSRVVQSVIVISAIVEYASLYGSTRSELGGEQQRLRRKSMEEFIFCFKMETRGETYNGETGLMSFQVAP